MLRYEAIKRPADKKIFKIINNEQLARQEIQRR